MCIGWGNVTHDHIINLIVCKRLKDLYVSILGIRNTVRFVRSSPSRLIKFQEYATKEMIDCKACLALDVAT